MSAPNPSSDGLSTPDRSNGASSNKRKLPVAEVAEGNGQAAPSSSVDIPVAKQPKADPRDFSQDTMKYIVVTGGVLSGIGKGVTTSSIGAVLKAAGFRPTAIKIDPYLNTDAGTMSPFEHGEVYVLDDGGEADLDCGNYERMMSITLSRDNNITTGKVYQRVIEKERRGDYLGKTVQVIPHVTDEIQQWIRNVAHSPVDGSSQSPNLCVIELGGTVGDIESMPFVEALRQFQFRVGPQNIAFVHVSLIPKVGDSQKSKPTQHSVRELRGAGISPDLLVCRCESPLDEDVASKLALHCHVPVDSVFSVHNVPNLFRVPSLMEKQGLLRVLARKLNLQSSLSPSSLSSSLFANPEYPLKSAEWDGMAARLEVLTEEVRIAVVGKYTEQRDAYLSIIKALEHAALAASRKLVIEWVEATDLEPSSEVHKEAWRKIKLSDGILVPGGFGDRGVEGKILATSWARRSGVPFLGICLGMQVAVIEYSRNVLGLADATSQEFNENAPHKSIIFMPEGSKTHLGGTMRLGSRRTIFRTTDCISYRLYGSVPSVEERHRHRYEVNPELVPKLEEKGLMFVGRDETGERMEIVEIPSHPFFVGVQFHPEFKSRPQHPSPPFLGLLLAASGQLPAPSAAGASSSSAPSSASKSSQ